MPPVKLYVDVFYFINSYIVPVPICNVGSWTAHVSGVNEEQSNC